MLVETVAGGWGEGKSSGAVNADWQASNDLGRNRLTRWSSWPAIRSLASLVALARLLGRAAAEKGLLRKKVTEP